VIDQHLPPPAQRNLEALIDERVAIECELIALDEHQWAIRGWVPVEGEVIVARFDNHADAHAALDQLEAAGLTPPRTRPRED
jgi:hypothetical protein